MSPGADDIAELDRRRRAAEGLRRTRAVMQGEVSRRDAPERGLAGGHRLELVEVDGEARYRLDGTWVVVGDVIEVYTNTANGWLRGRFEWTGHASDAPRIALNVWDPDGPRDEDGLPPWVGDLEASIPVNAAVRWGI